MNKGLSFSNIHRLFWVVLLVGLITSIVYWSIYTASLSRRLGNTEMVLASSTAAYSTIIREQRLVIDDITSKNVSLNGLLTSEQKRRLELEEIKRSAEKQIDTLTKLTTLDPELLKKYSKVYFLSENYTPPALKDIDSIYLADQSKPAQFLDKASPFLEALLKKSVLDNMPLRIISAYRSFDYQKTLKSQYKIIYGAGTANQFSADQGYSEHQLGTAVDFGSPDLKSAEVEFEDTAQYKWLLDNSYKFGFIISYPKTNSFYEYEPWHWRFVGKELAQTLHDRQEYFYEMDQRTIDAYLIKIFDLNFN